MTKNSDDVFADDDPFENLEERLTDALDSAAQAERGASEEPETTNDAELRLVMERIKTRSASRRSASTGVTTPTEGLETPAERTETPDAVDTAVTSADVEESRSDATEFTSARAEVIWGRTRPITNERDFRVPSQDGGHADAVQARDEGHGADNADDDPVIPEWSFAIESAEHEVLQAADSAIDLSDLPDFLFDDESEPPLESPTTDRNQPDFDRPQNSTFGSLVVDLGSPSGRGSEARSGATSSQDSRAKDSQRPGSRNPTPVSDAGAEALDPQPDVALRSSGPPEPGQSPSGLPPSGVAAALPPPGATAVQPVTTVGLTPGTQVRTAPAPTQQPRSEPQGPMTTTLVIPREPVQERKSNSRGLLYTAGGITLIVLSVLVYANYILGDGTSPPAKNMDPALEETTPTTQDTATTTSQAAATPEVELTGCDSEAAHVTITTQSDTPIVAIIRFQFLKDGQIYYEEESETPAITAGEPLTKSLLLIGKELPPEYVGVEPDNCEVQVIGVAAA